MAPVKSPIIKTIDWSVEKAEKGQEVAISLPKITFGRQVKEDQVLYSAISEQEFRKLKENKKVLTKDEITVLQEIAQIKRKEKPTLLLAEILGRILQLVMMMR